MGFVAGRSSVANIRKVLVALEHSRQNPHQDNVIIAPDAEKAFDNIDLDWRFRLMGNMGFQGRLMSFLASQYDNPMARINTTSSLSDPFILYKGTRQ